MPFKNQPESRLRKARPHAPDEVGDLRLRFSRRRVILIMPHCSHFSPDFPSPQSHRILAGKDFSLVAVSKAFITMPGTEWGVDKCSDN